MGWSIHTFEEFTLEKLYACLKLRVDVFIVEQGSPYEEIDDRDQASMHLLYEEEGKILAYARLVPAGVKYDSPSIGRVIVHPDARGRGFAKHLMERSLTYIQEEWNPEAIQLQGQTYLEKFYQSFGFETVSAPYDEDGIPHVDMKFSNSSRRSGEFLE
ncbi:GNAT family N-acetyltransferase [Planomicrobium sp. YIM 101495]|uniref:GNAT family N-acetyltransferase n=1 Tax=Planomicrobium sp. YIM 101495 TaxID=2665160 RepID=UPI0012B78711|nr:GNAT family N-acetyltransferase [Planomicrobium sp. YIM 101495]MTD31553.1 GNAT family N-acetyltransferase [Planomicrobium sp. YIM 101495]